MSKMSRRFVLFSELLDALYEILCRKVSLRGLERENNV